MEFAEGTAHWADYRGRIAGFPEEQSLYSPGIHEFDLPTLFSLPRKFVVFFESDSPDPTIPSRDSRHADDSGFIF